MRRTTVLLATLLLSIPLLVGCVHTRELVTPQTRDALQGSPSWALDGRLEDSEDVDSIYFVGVSTERTFSESEAIDLAYKDALRRAADYVGVTIEGIDSITTTFDESGFAVWPYKTKGGDGFGDQSTAAKVHTQEVKIVRNRFIETVRVIDTWTTAQRFAARKNHPGVLPAPDPTARELLTPPALIKEVNWMRYGELWKAKVLVAASRSALDALREGNAASEAEFAAFEIRVRDRDFDFQSAHHEMTREARQTRLAHDKALGEIERDYQSQLNEADIYHRRKATDTLFDKPTFNFMNNTLWYGQGIPRQR